MLRSGKLSVLNLLTGQKSGFSPLVEPIQVKLCRTDGHLGPLSCAKFHVNRCRGVGMRPKNIKHFHFLVKSRPAGATPLADFEKILGLFYA